MKILLVIILTLLTICVAGGFSWAAVWVWRRFRVSILLWVLAGKLAGLGVYFLALWKTSDLEKMVAAMMEDGGDPLEFHSLLVSLKTLFPLLTTAGFLMVAVTELAHLGASARPDVSLHPALKFGYRWRFVFGLFGLLCIIVPATGFYVYLIQWL